jgi:hypothetical protein
MPWRYPSHLWASIMIRTETKLLAMAIVTMMTQNLTVRGVSPIA